MSVGVARDEALARTLSAGAVLLLHTCLLLALLWAKLGQQPHLQQRERAIWLDLQMIPRAAEPARKGALRQPQRTPSGAARSAPVVSLPAEPDRKNLSGLHDEIFDCAPENLANLDKAQRARCRKAGAAPGYDPGAADYADRSGKVPGAKRWEVELARKQAPLLLPCGNPSGLDPIYTGTCILINVAKGFTFKEQYLNQPAYFDKRKKTHVDNNGDPPPMFRNRDH